MFKGFYKILVIVLMCSCSYSTDKKILYVKKRMIGMTTSFGQTITQSNIVSGNMPDSERRAFDTASMKFIKRQMLEMERSLALMPDSVPFRKEVIRDENGMIKSMSMAPDMNERYIFYENKIKYIRKHKLDTTHYTLIIRKNWKPTPPILPKAN